MKYEKLCYVNTLYPLFIFLLMENNKKSLIFLGKAIPKNIAERIENGKYLNRSFKSKNKIKKYIEIYLTYKNLEKFIEKEKLSDKEIYLQDNMEYSQFFLNHIDNCFCLEDGVINYNIEALLTIKNEEGNNSKIKIFRDRFLKRCKRNYKVLGLSEKIKKIYLTELLEIPEIIKPKVEVIKIKEKWDKLSLEERNKLLYIFGLDNKLIEELYKVKDKILLITQPFSEDKFISEEEKIGIYKDIINMYSREKIIIKPHPREKTEYTSIFPEIEVLQGSFPLEILMLLGIKFKEVVTIYSTAALNFKGVTNINYLGTVNYPKIMRKFGKIEKIYYKI